MSSDKILEMRYLIIGGAGFIGSNLADYFLRKKQEVAIFDNFSRKGAVVNTKWLRKNHPQVKVIKEDIRTDLKVLQKEIERNDVICHLAGQVAVTTSVANPREDFEINALGTFNVLEAIRQSKNQPTLVFTSTNKVYGKMEEIEVIEKKTRYEYKNLPLGVSEKQNLDFHSPYGCSKGAADQYVRDYARIYGLKTIVFRQSCIYGPRQFGVEDQGWLAWFIIASVLDKPIIIYGDGKQVRDILYINDLVKAFDLAVQKINKTGGQIYNIGGGRENTISIWVEFGPILEELLGKKIKVKQSDWRPGDQPVFISDIRKAKKELGWEPKIGVEEGIKKLFNWVVKNKELFKDF